jgi:hypothetical protein
MYTRRPFKDCLLDFTPCLATNPFSGLTFVLIFFFQTKGSTCEGINSVALSCAWVGRRTNRRAHCVLLAHTCVAPEATYHH